MKHTLICTINDSNNYGNRLQNYALKVFLGKYGTCDTIFADSHASNPWLLFKCFGKRFFLSITFLLQKLFTDSPILDKAYSFILFDKLYISYKYYASPLTGCIPRPNKDSYLVLGSDQIWNPLGNNHVQLKFRLGAYSKISTLISYAASFGVSDVSDEARPIFQHYLPRLKSISVREDRGAELVKEMTGLDAAVVLDPTLMLTPRQWDTITRNFVPDDDRYVLTYFLGKPNDQQEKTIREYARTHDCRIRRILDLRDKQTYTAGPQDFVELFSKAQYVFTDSYHACCFSILYHKQFTVFNRAGMEGKANMNSRMETLFHLFDLDSVVMDNGLAPQIDYHKVDQLLDQHRTESQTWLDNAITKE